MSIFNVFLIRVFLHLDWIRRDTLYLSVFSSNAEKYGPEKLQILTLFTQWKLVSKEPNGQLLIKYFPVDWDSASQYDSSRTQNWQRFKDSLSPAWNYMFKVNNSDTRTRREIYSKSTTKTLERHYWRRHGVFIVSFEHILHLVVVFLWLTLSR